MVVRTFTEPHALTTRARTAGTSARVWQQRHAAALRVLTDRPWPHRTPRGDLILVCDGLWHTVDGKPWTTYLLGLRAVDGEDLTFLRPILRPGHESQEQWREVIGVMPERTSRRIRAMVADSFVGVEAIADEEGWVLQRCHFHLLGKLAMLCGNRKRRIAWWEGRQRVQVLVRRAISDPDEYRMRCACGELRCLANDPRCPVRIRRIIRSTLRWIHDFRAWHAHPDLRLPATTNAMENMNGRIRALLNCHRGFSTATALERWIAGYVWFHPRMKCRPKNLQK